MNLKTIALATATGAALFAAVPAFAHGWDHRHKARYYSAPAYVYAPRPVIVAPRPYYYAPVAYAPVYYPPRPVVVRPVAPVLYGSVPIGPNVNIGFGVRF